MNPQRIEQLKKFIAEEPNDPFYVYALALEFLKTDKTEAKKLLKTVLEHHPTYLPVYYQLAMLFIELNELQTAENTLQRGITLAKEQKDFKALQELQNLLTNSIE